MIDRSNLLSVLGRIAMCGGVLASMSFGAHAALVNGSGYQALVLAGAPPDSAAAHVDPNSAASAYSGVVSINIRYNGQSFICSGAMVGKREVISAGHCVDTDGNGTVVDITKPGNDVRVIFNNSNVVGSPDRAIVTASKVVMNPNYGGFGKCPVNVPGFCVNDDISVITLSQDAPDSAKVYKVLSQTIASGQQIIMAGYGTSGDGINGFNIGPNFRIKRTGQNIIDLFEGDDENFTGFDANGFLQGGANEVYYADFDGTNSLGVNQDSMCKFYGVCSTQLANSLESNIGGGDSGGPSFISLGDEIYLVANNTFGSSGFGEEKPGAFGSQFGGVLLSSYLPWLSDATNGALQIVPEPGAPSLIALALVGLGLTRKRQTR